MNRFRLCERSHAHGGAVGKLDEGKFMWQQYRRTFIPTQLTILAIVLFIYISSGRLWVPAVFMFVMMQGASLIGTAWAVRLKGLILRRDAGRLPLQPR